MKTPLSNLEYLLFKNFIEKNSGIIVSEEKAYLIESRLSRLFAEAHVQSFEQLFQYIVNSSDNTFSNKVIDAITTNETMWFRDKSTWNTIEGFLPDFIYKIRTQKNRKIRLWSAAASTGQEAYSLAMLIDTYLTKNNIKDISLSNFEIIATDISISCIDIATKGNYDSITIMRGLDSYYKENYFTSKDGYWEINERIRKAVTFYHFNLQKNYNILGKFDLILCRYVFIYFHDNLKEEIIKKIHNSLVENGLLIIGSSEYYTLLNNYFKMLKDNSVTYFQRRDEK